MAECRIACLCPHLLKLLLAAARNSTFDLMEAGAQVTLQHLFETLAAPMPAAPAVAFPHDASRDVCHGRIRGIHNRRGPDRE